MKELKSYILDYDKIPSLTNIQQCICIAKKFDCVVKLKWTVKWSGHYSVIIHAEDDAQDIYDNHIPHIYGI